MKKILIILFAFYGCAKDECKDCTLTWSGKDSWNNTFKFVPDEIETFRFCGSEEEIEAQMTERQKTSKYSDGSAVHTLTLTGKCDCK